MTLKEWLDLVPAREGRYKDCTIVDWTIISERYVLLTLQMPQTFLGEQKEIVSMDASIETMGEQPGKDNKMF